MIVIAYHPQGVAVIPAKGAFAVDMRTGRTESTLGIKTMNNNGKIDVMEIPLDGVIKLEFLFPEGAQAANEAVAEETGQPIPVAEDKPLVTLA